MKYLYYLLFWSILLPAYGQENTLDFFVNDPLINKRGKFQIPSSFLQQVSYMNGLTQVVLKDTSSGSEKSRVGFVDRRGNFIIQPDFLQAENSPHGIIALKSEGNKWIFYKEGLGLFGSSNFFENYRIISPEYILISKSDQWGIYLLGKKESKLIEPRYKSVEQISGSTFKFTHFNTWTLRNQKKDSLYSYYCDSLYFASSNALFRTINKREKLINYDGSMSQGKPSICPGVLIEEHPISKMDLMLGRGNELKKKKGYTKSLVVDSLGKIILEFDSIRGPYENLYQVYNSGQMAILNEEGVLLSEFSNRFDKVFPFVEGRAKVMKAGRYGFIDQRGNVRVAPQYLSVRDFKEGLAAVIINGKWGFIDKDENIVVQPHYQEVVDFKNGISRAKVGGKWYFVTNKGKKLPNGYDEIKPSVNEKWLLVRNKKLGLADKNGKELLAPRYEVIRDIEKRELVIAKKGEKWGVVDYQENFVYPFEFDSISSNYYDENMLFMKKGKEEILDIKSFK